MYEICGVGYPNFTPLLFVSAGKPAGGATFPPLLCTPPKGGTAEKTERQPWVAVSRNGCIMADYREMYLTMARANERAVNILIQAQQECEELYMSSPEADIKVLPKNRPAPQ